MARQNTLLLHPPGEGVRVAVGDGEEFIESPRPSGPLKAPFAVTGTISNTGEEDTYELATKKGERYAISARSLAPTWALDPVIRVLDASGKQLATADGPGLGTAALEWPAPADGVYRVVVSDLFQKGSPELWYRLEVTQPKPEVVATTTTDALALAAGKTTPIKFTVTRKNGHKSPLTVIAEDLPPGVSAAPVEVPEKGGEVTLTLSGTADAKSFNGLIRLIVLEKDQTVAANVDAVLRKDTDKAPNTPFLEQLPELWLTVTGKPEAPAATKPAATKPVATKPSKNPK